MNMQGLLDWILDRLDEPSTWRGLVGMLTAAGVAISPHNAQIIVAAGLGIAGFIGVVTKDPGNVKKDISAAVSDVVVPVIEAAVTTPEPTASPSDNT